METVENLLNSPDQLESLYRNDRSSFRDQFSALEVKYPDHPLVQGWRARLRYEPSRPDWFTRLDLIQILLSLFVFGALVSYPRWGGLTDTQSEDFYLRNAGFLALGALLFYFLRLVQPGKILVAAVLGLVTITLFWINLLPGSEKNVSDTLALAGVHLPLVLWALVGLVFGNGRINQWHHYLRFNGDLLVTSAVLEMAWMALSGLTMGLFYLIGFTLEEFYPQYVILPGMTVIPLVAAITIRQFPGFVDQVSPWIARIFSPIVLLMLTVYMTTMIFSEKNLFTDREILLMFNLMLAGVLALILFSLSSAGGSFLNWVLMLLSYVAIVVNLVAFFAIAYRLFELGVTPNRLAVFGANALFLANLFWMSFRLTGLVAGKQTKEQVLGAMNGFLPAYLVWALFVVIGFPIIFSFA
ncbi:MAG: hypothetical protein FJZ78_09610 [Bacteroidetes bacterium]|nr:hypothetical protein [Bacteroidota bacterium]